MKIIPSITQQYNNLILQNILDNIVQKDLNYFCVNYIYIKKITLCILYLHKNYCVSRV